MSQSSLLVPVYTPANATNKMVTWVSSNPSIASIDSTGLVVGLANGNSVITATTVDGSRTATTTVTVQTPVDSITLNTFSLGIGNSFTIVPSVLPVTASITTLLWSTTNASIATVSQSGLVSGVAIGSTTIKAMASNGVFASWVVTVA